MANVKKKVEDEVVEPNGNVKVEKGTSEGLQLSTAHFSTPVPGASRARNNYHDDRYCEIVYMPSYFNMVRITDKRTGESVYVPVTNLVYCTVK